MAIKLDMSKAFDRVEWYFLEQILRRLGFSDKWIRLMMICVKTVTYSILLNGEPKGLIHPTRGIRQGDLLSLFLFLYPHYKIPHYSRNCKKSFREKTLEIYWRVRDCKPTILYTFLLIFFTLFPL